MPNEPPTPPRPPVRPAGISDEAWAEILARVAAGTSTFDRLLGSGKDLWESDEEFEQFMASIGRPVPTGRPRTAEAAMTFTGHIHDGKVVLDTPVPLPDGTPVRVEPVAVNGPPPADQPMTFAERYKEVIGKAVDLPEDMAENHDHYVHGTAKK